MNVISKKEKETMLIIRLGSNKNLLKEIKMEDILPRLESKAFQKLIKFLILEFHNWSDSNFDENLLLERAKEWWSKNLPEQLIKYDIRERHAPEVTNWALTMFLKQQEFARGEFLSDGFFTNELNSDLILKYLETFDQIKDQGIQRILSKSDINQIQSPQELMEIVEAAKPAYEQFKEKKLQKDAGAGMNKIFENEEWQIFIPETKAAACALGKETEWCTAAPGLNYYEQYHSKNNPLIVFVSKLYPKIRFQFHFGTEQFMNNMDHPINLEETDELFLLLRQVDNSLIKNLMYEFMRRNHLVFYHSMLANDAGLYANGGKATLTRRSRSEDLPSFVLLKVLSDNFEFSSQDSKREIFTSKDHKIVGFDFEEKAIKTVGMDPKNYPKSFPNLNKLLSAGWAWKEMPQK